MSDSLQPKIGILLDDLYGQHPTKPRSFFFEAVFEAAPELEELDPDRVDKWWQGLSLKMKLITHHTRKRRCGIWLPESDKRRTDRRNM